jgi:hypothetical protein
MPVSVSPHKSTEDDSSDVVEDKPNQSELISSPFKFIPKILRDKEDCEDIQQLNEKSEKMVKGIEGLGDILKRIETSLAANLASLEKKQAEAEEARPKKEKQK